MTYQLCKLRMKSLLFDVDCILWTLVLPIVLGLLFFFVMGKVDKFEEFQSIPIGIVDDMGKDGGCFRAFSSAKTEEGNEIFDVECIGLIDAQEKFEKEDISGYIVVDDGYRLYIQKDDVRECIIQTYLQSFLESKDENSNVINQPDVRILSEELEEKIDYKVIHFYALLAMTCLLCMRWGVKIVVELEGNLSWVGARTMVSSMPKYKVYGLNFLAALFISAIELLIELSFFHFVLKVESGKHFCLSYLACFMGVSLSLVMGAVLAIIVKGSVEMKRIATGLISLFGGMCSGIMFLELNYLIHTKVPVIGKILPSNLISDALYMLYTGSELSSFGYNMLILAVETILLMGLGFGKLRRIEYASL